MEDRVGNGPGSVAEYLALGAEALIGRENRRSAGEAPAVELEEHVYPLAHIRQIADVVYEQQSGNGENGENGELALVHRIGDRSEHVQGGGKEHEVARFDGRDPEGLCQMLSFASGVEGG